MIPKEIVGIFFPDILAMSNPIETRFLMTTDMPGSLRFFPVIKNGVKENEFPNENEMPAMKIDFSSLLLSTVVPFADIDVVEDIQSAQALGVKINEFESIIGLFTPIPNRYPKVDKETSDGRPVANEYDNPHIGSSVNGFLL